MTRQDLLQHLEQEVKDQRQAIKQEQANTRAREDTVLFTLAITPAILALFFWQQVSLSLASFPDCYGAVGKAVDGNAFANQLLRPTITGVVVPVISIALATLVSMTVNVLRARQIELQALVNKEACDCVYYGKQSLQCLGQNDKHATRRRHALELMKGHLRQLLEEC